MGGPVLQLAPLAAGVAITVGIPVAAAVLTFNEFIDAQQHGMGPPTGLVPHARWVIATHNWGRIELRVFATEDEARERFAEGRKLRRILVRLHDADTPDVDNGHGWRLPWHELDHAGWRWDLDNKIRRALLAARS